MSKWVKFSKSNPISEYFYNMGIKVRSAKQLAPGVKMRHSIGKTMIGKVGRDISPPGR